MVKTKNQDIFISITPQNYRENKKNLLISQINSLDSLKHLKNLKILSTKKSELKIKLSKLLSSLSGDLNKFEENLPDVPKTKRAKQSYEDESIIFNEEPDVIDNELLEIKNQLNKLNQLNQ